ncbi:hypothetical protein [Glutamicibacter ardleyensis]
MFAVLRWSSCAYGVKAAEFMRGRMAQTVRILAKEPFTACTNF